MLNLQKYELSDKWPALKKMQAEVDDLERQRQQAERAVALARQAIEHAREQDAQAASKALRAGKDIPAAKHEAKARTALESSERTLAAYAAAVQDAQADVAAFTAKHHAQLYAAMQETIAAKARSLAEHAREASALYGFIEDSRYDTRNFAPPAPAPEFDGPPAKLTNSIIGVMHVGQQGPARGEVEQMLAYLAAMENEFAPVGEAPEETPDAAA